MFEATKRNIVKDASRKVKWPPRAIFRALRGENLILHGQKEDGSIVDIPAKVNALGKIEEVK